MIHHNTFLMTGLVRSGPKLQTGLVSDHTGTHSIHLNDYRLKESRS